MHKVLLAVPNSKNWIGGLNYFKGLVNAYNTLPDKKIELMVISNGEELPAPLNKLKRIEQVSLPSSSDPLLKRIFRKIRRTFHRQDVIVERLLQEEIELFSHGYFLGKGSPIPNLRWIPDFQDRFLPEFFTKQELLNRKFEQNLMVKNKENILFSSQTAKNDFDSFYPNHECSTYVLNFVGMPSPSPTEEIMNSILDQFKIDELFFYIPNQIWAHKNHKVVIEALNILQQKGECPLVISTGHTEDYRNPDFFKRLQELVNIYNLQDRMRFLGLIEFESVSTLMRKCVATINPSLFEGWSTTVEESKSLGKRIILSNIPVHKEQNPNRAIFFEPHNAAQLAEAIQKVLAEYDAQVEVNSMKIATNELSKRITKFGEEFESIALKIISERKS